MRHKERLKALKLSVDVLTLTATPIPRTLHLSLAGLRDLTLLEQRLKYDRLGVNDALHQFEDDLGQRTLPEPERLLPVLDRIGADSRVVEVARQLARALAERIRATGPADNTASQPANHR